MICPWACADDNASGSVAILTAARLLAPHDFASTIRFVLFTGEEQGFHGSAAYAADCAARGDDIRGVINLDMIAYNSDSEPIIDLYATRHVPASLALTQNLAHAIRVYDLKLTPERFDTSGGPSDHGSFIERGYPAILVIEDMDDFSPYWHKITDRVSTLDLGYYADVTRAAVAAIAHLAVLVR
jgi:Zn-dependent M28 family amino/carboxypeptidase